MTNSTTSTNQHSFCLTARANATLTGVKEVLSFSDEALTLDTSDGKLQVLGKDIKIGKFNASDGTLTFSGTVHTIKYHAPAVPLLKRIFK